MGRGRFSDKGWETERESGMHTNKGFADCPCWNWIIWTWSLRSGCPHFIIAFKRLGCTDDGIKWSKLLRYWNDFFIITAMYRGHRFFSGRSMCRCGSANFLQTKIKEGWWCGYSRHLVCTVFGGKQSREWHLTGSRPSYYGDRRCATTAETKKSPLTSGHLRRI